MRPTLADAQNNSGPSPTSSASLPHAPQPGPLPQGEREKTLNYLRPLFIEEQGFQLRWIAVTGGVAAGAFVLFASVMWPVGGNVWSFAAIALIASFLLGVPLLIATAKLYTVIDAGGLHVRYFPFLNRTFPLDQIVAWEPMPYDPMEYGGWGVRGLPDKYGWAYSAHGRKGVRIEFTNGHRLMLGTQRSEELSAALAEAKGQGDGAGNCPVTA